MDDTAALTLKSLLRHQPVAALATLHRAEPAVSMVPFALMPGTATLIIHVSRLATHTADMLAHPWVGLMVMGSPGDADTSLALPRISLQGLARRLERESPEHAAARAAYVTKLPASEELFSFADFTLFLIEPTSARLVAGFGRAMTVRVEDLPGLLGD